MKWKHKLARNIVKIRADLAVMIKPAGYLAQIKMIYLTHLQVRNLGWGEIHNVVRPTMNKLSTMLFQVVTVEQCCNNMLTILFIVGRTTLFTPVDINLEQVVDFLNFYACSTS